MKKFYSIALAAAIALSASAAHNLKLDGSLKIRDVNRNELKIEKTTRATKGAKMVKIQSEHLTAKPSKKSRKVDAADTVEGTYYFLFGDYYFQGSIGEWVDMVEVYFEEDYLVFEPTLIPPFIGTYDEATGVITFSEEIIGRDQEGYYVVQYPFTWNYTIQDLDYLDKITGTYSDGTILFDEDLGISWEAYSDLSLTDWAGYYDIEDLLAAVKDEDSADDDTAYGTWTSVGNATFVDGWVLPAFGFDQWENAYEVELQQNDDNKTLYRLVDPYHGNSPVSSYNESTGTGYIMFDIADPDHVTFEVVEAGFKNSSIDISKFYCYNTLTYYMNYLESSSIQETIDALTSVGANIPYTTFKDGVVTLTSTTNADYGYINDACFGVQGEKYEGYNFQDPNTYLFIDQSAQITFPSDALNDVFAGESDAPVRYFNLQGIEITNPTAGQVVIRQQGTNTTKLMTR